MLICIASVGINLAIAEKTHIVQKGESVESISKQYNISKNDLISANPGIETLFYVGLKLNIPDVKTLSKISTNENITSNTTDDSNIPSQHEESIPAFDKGEHESDDSNLEGKEPGFEGAARLSFGFLRTEGIDNSSFVYTATIGTNYWFIEKNKGPFAGIMIGYEGPYLTAGNGKYKQEAHLITVPIKSGYKFNIYDKRFGITPYVGFSPKFCVSGKVKIDGEKYKIKKGAAFDFNVGASLDLWGFNILGECVIPVGKYQKMYYGDELYFSVGIGFGF